MQPREEGHAVEQQIEVWRAYLRKSGAIAAADALELEDHLREQMSSLAHDGLSLDEAFLVAVKRIGAIDVLTREFARAHSDRLWKQLVLCAEEGDAGPSTHGSHKLWVALGLAVAAAVAVKLPSLLGVGFGDGARGEIFYVLNAAFFTLPFITAYFAWERPLSRGARFGVAAVFAVAAVAVNVMPFQPPAGADTQLLTAIHLPLLLWFVVGAAYVGGQWPGSGRRMDFVRFTGEVFIYFVLIALGGGVLMGVSLALFQAIGIDAEPYMEQWILPCGAAGATVVAGWLVEAKQSVIENMAPVLTRIFAPLFTLLLLAFIITMLVTGRGLDVKREILIAFDLLLVVVFALLLYSFSARGEHAPAGLLDAIQLTLVVAALAVDVLALWSVGARIFEFGFTPNRVAALGENVLLLANLGGTAVLYAGFVQRRVAFSRILQWQIFYLYVFAGWAALVALGFPLLFGFR